MELRARPIFVVVLSPAAIAAPWVRREVVAAIGLHDQQPERIVLPVLAQACELPLLWRDYKWVSGPNDVGLSAIEASRVVIQTLGLTAQPVTWNEDSLFKALATCTTWNGLQAARHIYEYARDRHATFAWGSSPIGVGNSAIPCRSQAHVGVYYLSMACQQEQLRHQF